MRWREIRTVSYRFVSFFHCFLWLPSEAFCEFAALASGGSSAGGDRAAEESLAEPMAGVRRADGTAAARRARGHDCVRGCGAVADGPADFQAARSERRSKRLFKGFLKALKALKESAEGLA